MALSDVDIPTHCKAGVVVNEGPNFEVKVEMVPVPRPGKRQLVGVDLKANRCRLD
jgi:hypothetical protein